MKEIRVVIVGDDPLARGGLAGILSSRPGLSVAGGLTLGDAVARSASALRPDVVVCDLGQDSEAARIALREIARTGVPVLAIFGPGGRSSDALAAGARGIVARNTDADTLDAAVRAVESGLVVMDEAAAGPFLRREERRAPDDPLTPRELEVLDLLAEGLSNKLIADRLRISEHTVKFHVNAILGKLGAETRTEAVVAAARLGLILL